MISIKKTLYIGFLFLLLFELGISSQIYSQGINNENHGKHWVDSVYQSLTIEQRIAQLIYVRANYARKPYLQYIDTLIRDYNIGGVVFFSGDPISQVQQTNHWNSIARTPLSIAIDAEWGLAMRLSNTISYPIQMTLGAVNDNNLIYVMGQQIGDQCKRMGIQLNFAPVVDVNSNPKNPVIGMRSFGQNPELVAVKADNYMRGMQSRGVVASAKHFPGHGNTHMDSHLDLPIVSSPISLLKNNDLYPFQYLIDNGVGSVMIAHLSVPALDDTKNLPSTLSKKIVTDYLIDTMGFNGLIVTDGLDMKGVTKYYKEGMVALEALKAGNDILLIPDNIPLSIKNVSNAISDGTISEERIEFSCKKILWSKYISGAWQNITIDTTNLISDLNSPLYKSTSDKLMDAAITIVKDENTLLPLGKGESRKTALLVVGTNEHLEIEDAINQYDSVDVFHIGHKAKKRTRKKLISELKNYDVVIVSILNTNILASRRFGISKGDVELVTKLSYETTVILDIFASPYALNFFNTELIPTIIISYQEKPSAQIASADLIMEGSEKFGTLPVDAAGYKAGWGLTYGEPKLYFDDPSLMGIDLEILKKIDSTAINGIEIGAYPGCQILAAKDGAIFYNKSFGYHTYDNEKPVRWNDVYDLASLTKILATTPALMKMSDEGKIDINGKISDYLLMLKDTDKDSLEFIEVLSHQSGLQNWIPFYESTIDENGWDTSIYRNSISEGYPTRVAQNMYIKKGYDHNLFDSIIQSPFQDKSYHYSGLGFYLFKQLVENIANTSLDNYMYSSMYKPLNLNYLRYNPRDYFAVDQIIPTENDTIFRNQLLVGDVHDQGAAMLGGVSGNAGLFGNAHNVAVIMQMFINGGAYGFQKFFEPETIDLFTSYHFAADSNRRGLGFDKPLHRYEEHRTNCKDASPSSFGHSGFTGTYAWADPEVGLVYVFLSNRVHPTMSNSILMDKDIRTNIHQLFYEAIKP